MSQATLVQLAEAIRDIAHPLTGSPEDYDPLMDLIGDAPIVLIGEASHGSHEFYQQRAAITQRLISEKGFTAVAVEADFPDAYRVNCFVRHTSSDATAAEALGDFRRFPHWMWRNRAVLDFINGLRHYNAALTAKNLQVGFYGLDLYSMYRSIEAVLHYLQTVDPEAAHQARDRYACLAPFVNDSQSYGYAVNLGDAESCETAVVNQLLAMQHQSVDPARQNGQVANDGFFYAKQNARLVKNAEAYYRSMYQGSVSSWNLRDRHMAETLDHLMQHLEQREQAAKVVVWEHNSHLGDARATEMGWGGELNMGQLVREKYPREAVLVGFSTYTGTVTAASQWNASAELKRVQPALEDSYEALFHYTGLPMFLLNLRDSNDAIAGLRTPRLERAIGVIYQPETERVSHYFQARLPDQFDAIIHIDETRAVEPLDRMPRSHPEKIPETYPSAL